MKKRTLLLSCFAMLLAQAVSAQESFTQRGNFMLGSGIGFSSNESRVKIAGAPEEQGPYSRQWNVSPHLGYFLFNHVALGIGMDYTFSREKQQNTDKTEDSDLLFGPFARIYLPVGDDQAFILEGNFGFGNSSDNLLIGGAPQSIRSNIIAVGAGPGFTIFSNRAIGLEALFKYNYARSKFETTENGVTTQTITKTNQFAISLGIEFYFSGFGRAY